MNNLAPDSCPVPNVTKACILATSSCIAKGTFENDHQALDSCPVPNVTKACILPTSSCLQSDL